jgi:hypothetical protein
MKQAYFLFFLLLTTHLFALTELGVTYDFSHGRFGDNLITYLHAKWFAYEHQIPLIYKPFHYSSHLVLDDKEFKITELINFPRHRHYLDRGPVNPRIHLPILYMCPYFPEDDWEQRNTLSFNDIPWFYFQVNWKDPGFRKVVREMIAPKQPLSLVIPPRNCINIALHIREGGGYDDKVNLEWGSPDNPMKFPPLSFYAEGLKTVLESLNGQDIYCYLFTDAQYPEELANQLRSHLPEGSSIQFDYRKKQNQYNLNVLEDFFSFFNFDILIRSQSNFSMVPSLIHDFAMVYAPRDCEIEESGRVVITETTFQINPEFFRW